MHKLHELYEPSLTFISITIAIKTTVPHNSSSNQSINFPSPIFMFYEQIITQKEHQEFSFNRKKIIHIDKPKNITMLLK